VSELEILEVGGVRAGYEGIEALHGIDLTVARGEITAILGANGAGKSTLLSVVAGLVAPTSGRVSFDGEDVTGASPAFLTRRGICLIPEGRGIFPNLTVRENLWVMTHAGVSRGEVEERTFGQFSALAPRRDQQAGTLSGGEQQMLALARAVATRPKLLLVDELSMGLAPMIVERLYQHLADLVSQGVSIIVVEQFAQTALDVAASACVMAAGRVVKSGTVEEVAQDLHLAYLGHGNSP
jgi:branched-chain amino acid transport system ATP-binding protein